MWLVIVDVPGDSRSCPRIDHSRRLGSIAGSATRHHESDAAVLDHMAPFSITCPGPTIIRRVGYARDFAPQRCARTPVGRQR